MSEDGEIPSPSKSAFNFNRYYRQHAMQILGDDVPRPYINYSGISCSKAYAKYFFLLEKLGKYQQLDEPTPIQAQVIPTMLSRRNLTVVSHRSEDRVTAYLMPVLMHISWMRRHMHSATGPFAVILAPTEEICLEIKFFADLFGDFMNVNNSCNYEVRATQTPASVENKTKTSIDIAIATPQRFLNDILDKETDVEGVNTIVFDELDDIFELGYTSVVDNIISKLPKDKLLAVFTSTFPLDVRIFIEDYCRNTHYVEMMIDGAHLTKTPLRNVQQHVHVCQKEDKHIMLYHLLQSFLQDDSSPNKRTLIFVEEQLYPVHEFLTEKGLKVLLLLDIVDEKQRHILNKFKDRKCNQILITRSKIFNGPTIRIPDVKYVVNLDFPRAFVPEANYIFQTGRAGLMQSEIGVAHTFMTSADIRKAQEIVDILSECNQPIDPNVTALAQKHNSSLKTLRKRLTLFPFIPEFKTEEDRGTQQEEPRKSRWGTGPNTSQELSPDLFPPMQKSANMAVDPRMEAIVSNPRLDLIPMRKIKEAQERAAKYGLSTNLMSIKADQDCVDKYDPFDRPPAPRIPKLDNFQVPPDIVQHLKHTIPATEQYYESNQHQEPELEMIEEFHHKELGKWYRASKEEAQKTKQHKVKKQQNRDLRAQLEEMAAKPLMDKLNSLPASSGMPPLLVTIQNERFVETSSPEHIEDIQHSYDVPESFIPEEEFVDEIPHTQSSSRTESHRSTSLKPHSSREELRSRSRGSTIPREESSMSREIEFPNVLEPFPPMTSEELEIFNGEVKKFFYESFQVKSEEEALDIIPSTLLDLLDQYRYSPLTELQRKIWWLITQQTLTSLTITDAPHCERIVTYLLPAIMHIVYRKQKKFLNMQKDGPLVVILVHSNAMVDYVHLVAKQFCLPLDVTEIAIATPATVVKMLRASDPNNNCLIRCNYLIFDELHRMLGAGMYGDIVEIIDTSDAHLGKKYRQAFSAENTIYEKLFLKNKLKCPIMDLRKDADGSSLNSFSGIHQYVDVSDDNKFMRSDLTRLLEKVLTEQKKECDFKIIVFVTQHPSANFVEKVQEKLPLWSPKILFVEEDVPVNNTLHEFCNPGHQILFATDDMIGEITTKDVKLIINYDFPESDKFPRFCYLRRICQTDSKSSIRLAITLLTLWDARLARPLIDVFERMKLVQNPLLKALMHFENAKTVSDKMKQAASKIFKGKEKRGTGDSRAMINYIIVQKTKSKAIVKVEGTAGIKGTVTKVAIKGTVTKVDPVPVPIPTASETPTFPQWVPVAGSTSAPSDSHSHYNSSPKVIINNQFINTNVAGYSAKGAATDDMVPPPPPKIDFEAIRQRKRNVDDKHENDGQTKRNRREHDDNKQPLTSSVSAFLTKLTQNFAK